MAYLHWQVSPDLFHVGPLTVRWYGLFFAILFIAGYAIVRWMFQQEGKDQRYLDTLLIAIVAGTIIGARLGHVLFYEPAYYFRHPLEIPAVWRGGLASHGGAVGVLVALYLVVRSKPDLPYLWLLDRVVVPTALGGALIRLGNFFNSEILGKASTVPWAIVFVKEEPPPAHLVPRHPVQLYESACYLIIFIVLLFIYRRMKANTPRGLLLGLFLIGVFGARFVLEFFKEPQAAYEEGFAITVGQWLSIPFVLAGIALVWAALRAGNPAPRAPAKAKAG